MSWISPESQSFDFHLDLYTAQYYSMHVACLPCRTVFQERAVSGEQWEEDLEDTNNYLLSSQSRTMMMIGRGTARVP